MTIHSKPKGVIAGMSKASQPSPVECTPQGNTRQPSRVPVLKGSSPPKYNTQISPDWPSPKYTNKVPANSTLTAREILFKKERDEALETTADLIGENDKLLHDNGSLEKKIDGLKEKNDILQKQNDGLQEQFDNLHRNDVQLCDVQFATDQQRRAEIADLERQLRNAETTNSALEKKVTQLATVEKQCTSLRGECTSLQGECTSLRGACTALQEKCAVLQEEKSGFQECLGGLNARLGAKEEEKLAAQQTAGVVLFFCLSLLKCFQILTAYLCIVCAIGVHRTRSLDAALVERTAQAEQYRRERDEDAIELIELQDQADDMRQEHLALHERFESARKEESGLQTKNNELQKENSDLRSENDRLQVLVRSILDRQEDSWMGPGLASSTSVKQPKHRNRGDSSVSSRTALRSQATIQSRPSAASRIPRARRPGSSVPVPGIIRIDRTESNLRLENFARKR